MKDRVVLLIRTMNYTAAQFADEIGVQKSGISHIISGRNNPSLDFVQKILLRYPEVSPQWLLFGNGPMFLNLSHQAEPVISPQKPLLHPENQLPVDLFSTAEQPEVSKLEPLVGNSMDNSTQSRLDRTNIIQGKRLIGEQAQGENTLKSTTIQADSPQPAKEDRVVEKIVIFYRDRTFREYVPEN